MAATAKALPAAPRRNGSAASVRTRRMLVLASLSAICVALAGCQQMQGLSPVGNADAASTSAGGASSSSASGATPVSLSPGGGPVTLSQALATDLAYTTLVDKQGVSWAVEFGPLYDAASGRTCRTLKLSAVSASGAHLRVACINNRGIWQVVEPLRGTDSGPRF